MTPEANEVVRGLAHDFSKEVVNAALRPLLEQLERAAVQKNIEEITSVSDKIKKFLGLGEAVQNSFNQVLSLLEEHGLSGTDICEFGPISEGKERAKGQEQFVPDALRTAVAAIFARDAEGEPVYHSLEDIAKRIILPESEMLPKEAVKSISYRRVSLAEDLSSVQKEMAEKGKKSKTIVDVVDAYYSLSISRPGIRKDREFSEFCAWLKREFGDWSVENFVFALRYFSKRREAFAAHEKEIEHSRLILTEIVLGGCFQREEGVLEKVGELMDVNLCDLALRRRILPSGGDLKDLKRVLSDSWEKEAEERGEREISPEEEEKTKKVIDSILGGVSLPIPELEKLPNVGLFQAIVEQIRWDTKRVQSLKNFVYGVKEIQVDDASGLVVR